MSLLSTVRVLELSRDVSAAYCGRQFAAWGADVVVVESEGGSPIRRMGPMARAGEGGERSLLWAYVAAGKRTLRLPDFESGRGSPADLLQHADVLITDAADGRIPELGLTVDQVRRACPGLCVVSVTPFGLSGPYASFAGSDLVIQALSGYLGLNGLMGSPPLAAPGRLIGYAVGVGAFVGALAALLKRERSGRGDLVEASGLETLATMVPFLRIEYQQRDKFREGGTESGVRILPCSDGYISLLVSNPEQKTLFGAVLGIPDEAWPPDLYSGPYAEIVTKAEAFLAQYTARKTMDEIFYGLARRGFVSGKVLSPNDLLSEAQLKARDYFRVVPDPEPGALTYPGAPGRLANTEALAVGPAPTLDAAVRPEDLGWSERRPAPMPSRIDIDGPPLAGLRVLDLTQAWMGPYATLLFADLGAEVIKIESHKRPDVWRQASPNPVAIVNVNAAKVNRSHYFNSVNRNKRDLALDLSCEEGKALFRTLVKSADVVADNFTSRVMDKLGVGYSVLREDKPDLVMVGFSGFGKTGPWSDFKTNGSAMEALAGWDSLHRYPSGAPVLMGFYPADPICGLQMAALTLACLIKRNRTGEGEQVDGAMLDTAVGYLGELILLAGLGEDAAALAEASGDAALSGVFPCRGEDRWIAITVADDRAWAALLGLPGLCAELASDRFRRTEGRGADRARVHALLADWTAGWDPDALMHALQRVGVAAGVVRGAAEALGEPHLVARDFFKTMTHADMGAHRYNGFPWRFAGCELRATLPPPRLGEHSEELLRELLCLTQDQIEGLKARGVTGAVL